MKSIELTNIYNFLKNSLQNNDGDAKQILYKLMIEDILSITELVSLKEMAFNEKYNNLKEDSCELNAIAIMYKEEMYKRVDNKGNHMNGTKEELDDRFINISKKLGFFKIN